MLFMGPTMVRAITVIQAGALSGPFSALGTGDPKFAYFAVSVALGGWLLSARLVSIVETNSERVWVWPPKAMKSVLPGRVAQEAATT